MTRHTFTYHSASVQVIPCEQGGIDIYSTHPDARIPINVCLSVEDAREMARAILERCDDIARDRERKLWDFDR